MDPVNTNLFTHLRFQWTKDNAIDREAFRETMSTILELSDKWKMNGFLGDTWWLHEKFAGNDGVVCSISFLYPVREDLEKIRNGETLDDDEDKDSFLDECIELVGEETRIATGIASSDPDVYKK